MDRSKPTKAANAGLTRLPGYHWRPYQLGNPADYSQSAPSRRLSPARGKKGDKGVGLPSTDIPARHPGCKRYHQNLHSDLAAAHHPPLPQSEEYDGPTG